MSGREERGVRRHRRHPHLTCWIRSCTSWYDCSVLLSFFFAASAGTFDRRENCERETTHSLPHSLLPSNSACCTRRQMSGGGRSSSIEQQHLCVCLEAVCLLHPHPTPSAFSSFLLVCSPFVCICVCVCVDTRKRVCKEQMSRMLMKQE